MARITRLLHASRHEVLLLTSQRLLEQGSPDLLKALESCAQRGLRVKVLVEAPSISDSRVISVLQSAGAEVLRARKKFSWFFRPLVVHSEVWIFDRQELINSNERVRSDRDAADPFMTMECQLGSDVASGAASYFDMRWDSQALPASFSVRHKDFGCHSGSQAELEFFGALAMAQREILLSLPTSRVSKRVEGALHAAIASGVAVTLFANADGDNAPALKRLRRLANAGATVKICGRRLGSECAIIDGGAVFMGSLPSSSRLWRREAFPVFVLQSEALSAELRTALESQVSVEINNLAPSPTLAVR
ncbi:MAG TPA: hypothetical protein VIH99_02130 [Bdellovibrionota bacterium]|jgi:phosphatidylserine/phosphatidylglycerophosphate/cardiolipin synthase-like enzyme